MSSNIVEEWLRSLHLGEYAKSFLDNGYDDLEICKQVGDPDLDAIGVTYRPHRRKLLESVRTLREEGAAPVYFTLEETGALHEECHCDNTSYVSSRASSVRHGSGSEKDCQKSGPGSGGLAGSSGDVPGNSPASSSAGSAQELGKCQDEYEEGKAELVRIPQSQLQLLLRDKLAQEEIRLSQPPYSTPDGQRGYLEGLASRYADQLKTHYGDVLDHLEKLWRREWAELSPRIRVLSVGQDGSSPSTSVTTVEADVTASTAPLTDSSEASGGTASGGTASGGTASVSGMTSSVSQQPLYVPGKYSPSSCLSDKEEDEIYGFSGYAPGYAAGYGIYGKHMLQQRQQAARLILGAQHASTYQPCLSPRSAYFYEFPPNGQGTTGAHVHSNQQTGMKKTLSRLLKGLKPSHRRDKENRQFHHEHGAGGSAAGSVATSAASSAAAGSPGRARTLRHARAMTPDGDASILSPLSHIATMGPLGPLDGRDYYLHLNGAGHSGIEETIHRLKVEEALKQKERYHKEHEEILKDIRQGLLQLGRGEPAIPGVEVENDTYMYDSEVRCGNGLPAHWYDEPPYESDPEDFLMGAGNVAAATMALAAVRNGSSRLSAASMDRIELDQHSHLEPSIIFSSPHHAYRGKLSAGYPCRSSASEGGLSPCRSPDGEDTQLDHRSSNETPHRGSTLVGRMRGLRQDVQRKISRLKATTMGGGVAGSPGGVAIPMEVLPPAGSLESIPSGSGSSTQAFFPGGSNHSSVSPQEIGHVLGKARALVDYTPSPYDRDALKFKKGDIIDVIAMNPSGLWRGYLNGRVGSFKFINIELVPSIAEVNNQTAELTNLLKSHLGRVAKPRQIQGRGRPWTVEELLRRVDLEDYISIFILNGYEKVEAFGELRDVDLDYLGIKDTETRAKILAAVDLLHDCDSPESNDEPATSNEADDDEDDEGSSCSDMSGQPTPLPLSGRFPSAVPFQRLHFPRDSGCYDAEGGSSGGRHWSSSHSKNPNHKHHRHHHHHHHPCRSNANNLDSIQLEECSRARNNHEPPPAPAPHDSPVMNANYLPNIPVANISPTTTSVDSYVVARGKVVSVEPCPRSSSRGSMGRTLVSTESSGGGSALLVNRQSSASSAQRRDALNNSRPSPVGQVEAKSSIGNEYLKRLLTNESDKEEEKNEGVTTVSVNGEDCGEGAESPPGKGVAIEVALDCENESHPRHGPTEVGDCGSTVGCATSGANVSSTAGSGGAALSEKSSDSGVSSSSISSSHPISREPHRNPRKSSAPVVSSLPVIDFTPTRCQFRVQK